MPDRSAFWTIVLLLVAATIGPRAAAADTPAAGKTPIQRAAAVEGPATGQVRPAGSAGTTMVLLGLLLAAAIVGRRIVQQRGGRRTGRVPHSPIRLVSRQQIDAELYVRLLQVGPRLLVVASTPQGVTTLTEITDPEEIALLTGETIETAGTQPLFAGESVVSTVTEPTLRSQPEATPPAVTPRPAARFSHAVKAGG